MADGLQTIVDLLNNNWDNANTDSITPTISKIFNKKRVGGLGGVVTYIGVYSPAASNENPIDFGYNTVERIEFQTVDIRTSNSYSHVLNCKDEVKRILRANRKSVSGFDEVVVRRINDLSDATRNLWRFVLDIELKVYAEAL